MGHPHSMLQFQLNTSLWHKNYKGQGILTRRPSWTVSRSLIGSSMGLCHLLGSHRIVLLKANPDITEWNLWYLCFGSLTCHPITSVPLQTGPSSAALRLFSATFATVHIPNRLKENTKHEESLRNIEKSKCPNGHEIVLWLGLFIENRSKQNIHFVKQVYLICLIWSKSSVE